MTREIIKATLNDVESDRWNEAKAKLGFSNNSGCIKFIIDSFIKEWDKLEENVPQWYLERKLEQLKYGYKASKKKVIIKKMTKVGLEEKEKEVYVLKKNNKRP